MTIRNFKTLKLLFVADFVFCFYLLIKFLRPLVLASKTDTSVSAVFSKYFSFK